MQPKGLKKIYFRYSYFLILFFLAAVFWRKELVRRENEAYDAQFELNCEVLIEVSRALIFIIIIF